MAKKDLNPTGPAGIADYGYPFVWSTSEQIWPFERSENDDVLYAKYVAFGALPNTTTKNVAHGIGGTFSGAELFRGEYAIRYTNATYFETHRPSIGQIYIDATNIVVQTESDWTGGTGHFYLIYWK